MTAGKEFTLVLGMPVKKANNKQELHDKINGLPNLYIFFCDFDYLEHELSAIFFTIGLFFIIY